MARVFGYAQAAVHWQRAVELWPEVPDAAVVAAIDLPGLYVRAVDALEISGDGERAGVLAEEAYRQFAGHPDPGIAAVIHVRATVFRGVEAPDAGLPLIKEALRLFGQAPPSADHAEAWLRYATMFVFHAEGRGAVPVHPEINRRAGGQRHDQVPGRPLVQRAHRIPHPENRARMRRRRPVPGGNGQPAKAAAAVMTDWAWTGIPSGAELPVRAARYAGRCGKRGR